ncbi:hypothetical protein RD792_011891 [Penstemon davidsonii]|uniref:Arginine/serine-rich splicing factor n=1 Tax=Penstemon davidsonii TaxID=160366 RepID=A0ABR0CVC2_9LAMI|nr:hypothetical protein RD792_011891 [Penstemon davidsonii]
MPRYEDRYGSGSRLYVGHLSSRTRSRDLEHIFSRYGRVRDVDMKRDYAFVEFSDPRDADDARYRMDGRDVDGRRITVEFAKGVPRGPGGVREYVGRGPAPGSGRCFNCGLDGHWARDCKAGDWKNKCYRCGERGHIERNCQNSPKKSTKRDRSYSRSPVRSRSPPRRGRSRSRSFSRSPSYRSRSPPAKRGRDSKYEERRLRRSPSDESREPKRNHSPTPERDSPIEGSPSSPGRIIPSESPKGYSPSPRETSQSPSPGRIIHSESPPAYREDSPRDTKGRSDESSPHAANGSPSVDKSPVYDGSPVGSESP